MHATQLRGRAYIFWETIAERIFEKETQSDAD